jgi:hypothetical protein
MEGGGLERLPGDAKAGTELVFADVGPILVVTQASAQDEPIRDPPFVLDIEAGGIANLFAGIGNCERRIDRNTADDRQQRVGVGDVGRVGSQQQSAAQSVRVIEPIGSIGGTPLARSERKTFDATPLKTRSPIVSGTK